MQSNLSVTWHLGKKPHLLKLTQEQAQKGWWCQWGRAASTIPSFVLSNRYRHKNIHTKKSYLQKQTSSRHMKWPLVLPFFCSTKTFIHIHSTSTVMEDDKNIVSKTKLGTVRYKRRKAKKSSYIAFREPSIRQGAFVFLLQKNLSLYCSCKTLKVYIELYYV